MKAILWDMDGTLVDSEPLHAAALASALQHLDLPEVPDLHAQVLGLSAQAVYDWLRERAGLTLPFDAWIALKYERYLAGIAQVRAFPEALACWRAAEAAGVPQAVVSNSDRIIVDANLSQVGLTRPGGVTLSRNDVRAGKPDPELYLRAAWLLGVDPAETVVVEDSAPGAQAGLAAGMTVYLVPYAEIAPPAGTVKLPDFATLTARLPAAGSAPAAK